MHISVAAALAVLLGISPALAQQGIPSQPNATNLPGVGTMAKQNATAVAITGGNIDGTAIGVTTAANAKVTALFIGTAQIAGGGGGGALGLTTTGSDGGTLYGSNFTNHALDWDSSGNATFGAAMTNAHLGTGTNADFVCLSGAGLFLIQTSACTISSLRFKQDVAEIRSSDALHRVLDLNPVSFRMKPAANPDPNYGARQVGLLAEDIARVMPECAIYENDMKTPKSYRQECIIAQLVGAVAEQQKQIDRLEHHKR